MFYAQQTAIYNRLKAALAANAATERVRVLTAAELADVPDARNYAPAVHVVYDGYSVGDNVAGGKIQGIEQNWLVVCHAKNTTKQGDPTPAATDAGKIAEVVLAALLGYDPLSTGATLRLFTAPAPAYDGGYCYLPLNFRLRTTFKGITP